MRYIISTDQVEHPCCYEVSIIDTKYPIIISGKQYKNWCRVICECPNIKVANVILLALNTQEANNDAVQS